MTEEEIKTRLHNAYIGSIYKVVLQDAAKARRVEIIKIEQIITKSSNNNNNNNNNVMFIMRRQSTQYQMLHRPNYSILVNQSSLQKMEIRESQ
jgi:hypothetical protein